MAIERHGRLTHLLFAAAASLSILASHVPAHAQVSFDEVLAAPDDPELNLAYARQEIAAGRLQSAASVLERMLLSQPDWDAARLTYGIVLYRLQDNLGAIREFVKLEDRNLPARQEADRLRYLRLAQNGDNALRISGSQAIGLRYDDNPTAAGQATAAFVPPLAQDGDFAATSYSVLRAEYDFGTDPAITAFATVGGSLRHYFDTSSSRISNNQVRAGLTYRPGNLELSVFAIGDFVSQDYDLFSRSAGFGGAFAYDVADGRSRTRVLGGVSGIRQDYDDTEFTGLADERNGWLVSTDLGVQHFVTDAHRFSAGIAYSRKNARDDGFSYDRTTLSAGYLGLLGKGVYTDNSIAWTALDYDAPFAPQTGQVRREDRTWRVRTALGAPVGTLFTSVGLEAPRFVEDLVLQGGLTYTDRSSNVSRFDFDNVGADLLLIRRFQF